MKHLPEILKNTQHSYGPYTEAEAKHLLTALSKTCEDFKYATPDHINRIASWIAVNGRISFYFYPKFLGTAKPFHGEFAKSSLPEGTELLNSLIVKPLLKRKR